MANELTNPPSPKLTIAYSAQAELGAELAKMLMLVAPISMTAEQHELWLRSAVGALEGIRADEVRDVLLELQRKVTRPAQIVPEIANLVAEKRARSQRVEQPASPYAAEMAINEEARKRRAAVSAKDKRALSDIWEWERQARMDTGLHAGPYPKPLARGEIEAMPAHIRQMGFAHGFLVKRGGEIVEA
jgi:hypothetical protein